jgi:hypothetical protein
LTHTEKFDYDKAAGGDAELILERKAHFELVDKADGQTGKKVVSNNINNKYTMVTDRYIWIYDPVLNGGLGGITPGPHSDYDINDFAWSNDGTIGLAACDSGVVLRYDPATDADNFEQIYPAEGVSVPYDLNAVDFFTGTHDALLVGDNGLVLRYRPGEGADGKGIEVVNSQGEYCAIEPVIRLIYQLVKKCSDIGVIGTSTYDLPLPIAITPESASWFWQHGFNPSDDDLSQPFWIQFESWAGAVVYALVALGLTIAAATYIVQSFFYSATGVWAPISALEWGAVISLTTAAIAADMGAITNIIELCNAYYDPEFQVKDGMGDYPDFTAVECTSDREAIVGGEGGAMLKYRHEADLGSTWMAESCASFTLYDEPADYRDSRTVRLTDFWSQNGLLTPTDCGWSWYKPKSTGVYPSTITQLKMIAPGHLGIVSNGMEMNNVGSDILNGSSVTKDMSFVYGTTAQIWHTELIHSLQDNSIVGLDTSWAMPLQGNCIAVSGRIGGTGNYLRGPFGQDMSKLPTGFTGNEATMTWADCAWGSVNGALNETWGLFLANDANGARLYKYTPQEFYASGEYKAWVQRVSVSVNKILESSTTLKYYLTYDGNAANPTWHELTSVNLTTLLGNDLFEHDYNGAGFKLKLTGDEYHTPVIYDLDFLTQYIIPQKIDFKAMGDTTRYTTNESVMFKLTPSESSFGLTSTTRWNFGDASFGQNVTVQDTTTVEHRYTRPGRYRVEYNYTSAGGSSAGSMYVTINNRAPTLIVRTAADNGSAEHIALKPNCELKLSHQWSYDEYPSVLALNPWAYRPDTLFTYIWGDGTAAYTTNSYTGIQTHTYVGEGRYTVTVQMRDNGMYYVPDKAIMVTQQFSVEVNINPAPIALLKPDAYHPLYAEGGTDYTEQYGHPITFNGGPSKDDSGGCGANDNIVLYEFKLYRDGVLLGEQTGANATWTWTPTVEYVGMCMIYLRVKDDNPVPKWSLPANGTCLVRYAPVRGDWTITDDLEINGFEFSQTSIIVQANVSFTNCRIDITNASYGQLAVSGDHTLTLDTSRVTFHPDSSQDQQFVVDYGATCVMVDSLMDCPPLAPGGIFNITPQPERHYYYGVLVGGSLYMDRSAIVWPGINQQGYSGVTFVGTGSGTITASIIGHGQNYAVSTVTTGAVLITASFIGRQDRFDFATTDSDGNTVKDTAGIYIQDGLVTVSGCMENTAVTNEIDHRYDDVASIAYSSYNIWQKGGVLHADQNNISFGYLEGIRQMGGASVVEGNQISQNAANGIQYMNGSAEYRGNYIFGKGAGSYGIIAREDITLMNNTFDYVEYGIVGVGCNIYSIGSRWVNIEGVNARSQTGANIYIQNYIGIVVTDKSVGFPGLNISGYNDGVLIATRVTNDDGRAGGILLTDWYYGPVADHEYINQLTFQTEYTPEGNVTVEMYTPDRWVEVELEPTYDPPRPPPYDPHVGHPFNFYGIDTWWSLGGLIVGLILFLAFAVYFYERQQQTLVIISMSAAVLYALIMLGYANGWAWYYMGAIWTGLAGCVYYAGTELNILPKIDLSALKFWG